MAKTDSNKNDKYPSTFTLDNFSSTATLAKNEINLNIGRKENSVNEKTYNQYEHRNLEHPNTFSGALIHILKSSLGSGILAIPLAFKHAGLLEGFIGTMLVGFLCTHTIQILVEASQRLCVQAKVPQLSFAETAEYAFKYGPKKLRPFSKFAKFFVDFSLIVTYFAGNAVYVVIIGETIKEKIMDKYYPEYRDTFSKENYMAALGVPLLIFCQVRPLKFLVPFSFIANCTMLSAFGITFYYMFDQMKVVNIEDRAIAKGLEGIPKFLNIVIFAMEGIGTIMPVENSMNRDAFLGCPGVLNIGMTLIVMLYATIGFCGYYAFGEDTQSSITLNLPPDDLASAAQICIVLAVFFTFMLQFYVPMEITWRNAKSFISKEYENIFQIVFRCFAVCAIVLIGITANNLETIVSLVAAVCFSTLGLLIPAVIDIVMRWNDRWGFFNWRLHKNICVILIAVFCLVSGIYFTINP